MAWVSASTELWRPIPGYEGSYEISSLGRVLSVERVVSRGIGELRVSSKIIKQHLHVRERWRVCLTIEGRHRHFFTSSLVALAFIGPRPVGMEVCHNDGNQLNNTAVNLRYDTAKANAADRTKHGTQCRGTKVASAKLTEELVIAIRDKVAVGASISYLAKQFGVGVEAVRRVAKRQTWRHVA